MNDSLSKGKFAEMTPHACRSRLLAVSALAITLIAPPAQSEPAAFAVDPAKIAALIHSEYPKLEAVYRDIHSHPELAFQESRTAALLAKQMRRLGYVVAEHVGGTGVVALLRNGDGPTVMVRTELDALPMPEQTGLPYASVVDKAAWEGGTTPVMHACGHDLHMTVWLGTARALLALKEHWRGTAMFVAQPAEETVSGAKAMLADGLLARFPKPDFGFAVHNEPLRAGSVIIQQGVITSAVDNLEIVFRGRGAHGSMPSAAIDPIVIAARFVTDVQAVVSREKDEKQFGVVTVGAFQAGTVGNIIPEIATLRLTLRSHSSATRELLLDGVRRAASASAAMARAPAPDVKVLSSTAAVSNDERLVARTAALFRSAFGQDFSLVEDAPPAATSEDFSEFVLAGVPSVYFNIGTQNVDAAKANGGVASRLHSPQYAPVPEPTIRRGTEAMTLAVLGVVGQSPH
jgi:amidohydrolase